MDILLITEDFINPFKFWFDGHLVLGMCFRNEFFGQILAFSIQERQKLFCQLEQTTFRSSEIIITASKHRYIVWLNLRSLSASHVLSQSALSGSPKSKAPEFATSLKAESLWAPTLPAL